jgi:hypothetical protein
MNAGEAGRRPYAAALASWAQTGVALLLTTPAVVTFSVVNRAELRARHAVGDQPDLRYYVDGYRTSGAQILAVLGLASLVIAGLLLRLAGRRAETGRRLAAAVIWPWVAFLFMLCATWVNPENRCRRCGRPPTHGVTSWVRRSAARCNRRRAACSRRATRLRHQQRRLRPRVPLAQHRAGRRPAMVLRAPDRGSPQRPGTCPVQRAGQSATVPPAGPPRAPRRPTPRRRDPALSQPCSTATVPLIGFVRESFGTSEISMFASLSATPQRGRDTCRRPAHRSRTVMGGGGRDAYLRQIRMFASSSSSRTLA